MLDSDITNNMTSDCQELMPTQEMPETHESDCTCESCCQISISNCQDNRDQCEETESPSGRMGKMKEKLMPIMTNCAVILAVIGLSGSIGRAETIERIQATNIEAIHRQAIPRVGDIERYDVVDINRSVINGRIVDRAVRAHIEGIESIEISSNQIATEIEAV